MRKTFSIKVLLEYVNDFNAESADDLKQAREANNTILERVLMSADSYRGFGYLTADMLHDKGDAMSVGIREQREDGTWNFDNTDHTRVHYYYAAGL